MALEISDFYDRVRAELGDDVAGLIQDQHISIWVNDGKDRLGALKRSTDAFTWVEGAATVTLPTDFVHVSHIRLDDDTDYFPPYEIWGTTLTFTEQDGASIAGGATLYYFTHFADIDEDNDSTLPPEGNQACVSWVCHRFFRRLANSRAEFKRYATLMGANGSTIDDLRQLSSEYLQDFNDARASLEIPGSTGFVSFYD